MAVNVGEAVGYLDLDTSKFKKGLSSALQELQAFRNSASTMGDKVTALGSSMTKMGSTLTKSVTAPLLGLGTAAVATTAKFESAMSQVQATMGITKDATSELEGQTVNTMEALGDLAKELGENTKFSATEAAEAINNMAMAGYNVEEIYTALPQVLSLASAGALDLDYATQLVANGLNVMGLKTEDAGELADKLAVTASNAYGSVSDFGEGLLIAGAQAKLANVNLTDTMTALGILGDNGISASEGGTYLRNTLKNLYTPTDDAAKALEELGVKTANSDGTLRDFQDVLKDLGGSLDGLTDDQRIQYMSRIFDTRTISAANALLANSGERWDELSTAIDGAGGAAERMAETQLDNLPGQLTILKSSLEGAAIAFGELLLPVIKDIIAAIQRFTDWINNLSDTQKKVIVKIAEVLAVVGPLLLIVGKVVTLVSKVMNVIKILKPAIAALNAVMAANPIILIVTLIAGLIAALVALYKKNEDFRNFVDNAWAAIKETVSTVVNALVTFFTETIPNALKAAIDWVKNFADKIAKFFTETIPNKLSQLIDWFKSLPGKIWDALLNAIAKVKQWGVDLGNWVKTKIPEVVTSIVTKFKELPGKLLSVGKNLVEGLWNGINDKVGWVLNKIKGFGSKVLNGIKSIFGIASPSKKTKEMGKYLAEGLALGIEDNEDLVTDSADSLAGGLLETLKSMTEKLAGMIDLVSNPFEALNSQKSAYDAITESIWKQIEALKELKAIRDLIFIRSSLNRADSILAEMNSSRNSHSVQHSQGSSNQSSYVGGNTYNFYSPKAISPVEAAKLMKQTAQQMALDA